jgi:hypothetical protein
MRAISWATCTAILLVACGGVRGTERTELIAFAIESQPLTDALNEFARQAHVQIMRRDEEVSLEGLVAPEVAGRYSAEDALKRILSGTQLKYEFVNSRTVRIATSIRVDR